MEPSQPQHSLTRSVRLEGCQGNTDGVHFLRIFAYQNELDS